MIKAAVTGQDGVLRIVLGLSDKNAERIAQQRPAMVLGDDLGLMGTLILVGVKDADNNVAVPKKLADECLKAGRTILLLTISKESLAPAGDQFTLAEKYDFGKFTVIIGRGKTEASMSAAMHEFISPTTRIIGGKLPSIDSN